MQTLFSRLDFPFHASARALAACGDSLGILRSMGDRQVDLIFADPPYNLGKDFGNGSDSWKNAAAYLNWCRAWIDEAQSLSARSLALQQDRPIHPVEKEVRNITGKHDVEMSLALALMKQESNFRKYAVSRMGAAGLCQIMPATGRDLGLRIPRYSDPKKPEIDPKADERFDPYRCMDAGFRYLRQLLNRYDGNVPLALSAYNAGMGRTKKRVARIHETTTYVADIMTHYWFYQDEAALGQAMGQLVSNIRTTG